MKTLNQTEASTADTENYLTPDVNIYETKDGYVLEAELPGVTKDGLEITVADQKLSIIGRTVATATPGEVLFRERSAANYRRRFGLDPAIDTARITARLDQGVLFLTLPKSEAVKPRQIAVSE